MSVLLRARAALATALRARREGGATAVEYAIMAGFIALVIIGAVTALGASLSPFFVAVAGAF